MFHFPMPPKKPVPEPELPPLTEADEAATALVDDAQEVIREGFDADAEPEA
jgi:hypothetical protein